MTKQVAIGWTGVVCGLCLAFFGFGRQTGFSAGVRHAERFNVAWMANESAAAHEVLAHGGTIDTLTTRDGWTATVTIDGETFAASDQNRERAVLAAVAKWKGL